ncbi:DNA-binding domain-containing protein [Geofilum sp. OHC36d9]|uniref:DNA-binding domain-containing protein n=1 Tax=Geofilum sp. OHC36d9 TaxID=3458413 RepID=UPI0040347D05
MPLRYGLIENPLTSDPDDYMAVTFDNQTVGIDEIVERMISRGSTVTKAEALGSFEEFNLAVCDIVKSGFNIKTDLFSVYPTVAGVFNDASEGFNSSKHSINLNLRAGQRLIEAVANLSVEKVTVTESKPVLQLLTDLKSGAINESATIGQIVSIKGALLKIAGEAPSVGVFFIAADGTETRIADFVKNKPSELLFFIPDDLAVGSYDVEVRTVLPSHKSVSVGQLSNKISIIA